MAEIKSDGTVTKPQGVAVPGGSAKPSTSPGNTKPAEVGGSSDPLNIGPAKFLIKDAKRPDEVFDKDGFRGVDPIYQNGANATDRPIV